MDASPFKNTWLLSEGWVNIEPPGMLTLIKEFSTFLRCIAAIVAAQAPEPHPSVSPEPRS